MPGMAAPFTSTTVPSIEPVVVVWAAALTKNESARASTVKIRMGVFMLTIPFVVFNCLEVFSF
jgi:hypothetical protein